MTRCCQVVTRCCQVVTRGDEGGTRYKTGCELTMDELKFFMGEWGNQVPLCETETKRNVHIEHCFQEPEIHNFWSNFQELLSLGSRGFRSNNGCYVTL